jgi:hypothetical protein
MNTINANFGVVRKSFIVTRQFRSARNKNPTCSKSIDFAGPMRGLSSARLRLIVSSPWTLRGILTDMDEDVGLPKNPNWIALELTGLHCNSF